MEGLGVVVVSGVTFRRLPILDWRRRLDERSIRERIKDRHVLHTFIAWSFCICICITIKEKQLELVDLMQSTSTMQRSIPSEL
jgi:hypothetical protein